MGEPRKSTSQQELQTLTSEVRHNVSSDSEQLQGSSQPRQKALKSPQAQECLLQWACARELEQDQSKLRFVSERNFGDWILIGWLVNISETRQGIQMAAFNVSATTTTKHYEGITVKGGCCPANELIGNQIL